MCAIAAAADASPQDAARAQALFDEGKRLMDSGPYAEACPKLAESQRLDPGGGTLLALALCHEAQGKTASAWADFGLAATAARRDGRADRLQAAQQHIRALEPRLVKLAVGVSPQQGDVVVVCDRTTLGSAEWGEAVPVDPGQHTVTASAPGKKPWSTAVATGAEGTTVTVTVPVLDAEAIAASPPSPSAAAQPESPAAPARGGGPWKTAGLVTAGVGVVGLGVGTVFGVMAMSRKSDATSCTIRGSSASTIGTTFALDVEASSVTVSGDTIYSGSGTPGNSNASAIYVDPLGSGVAAPIIRGNRLVGGKGGGGRPVRSAVVRISASYPDAVLMNGDPADGGSSLSGNVIEVAGADPTEGVFVGGNATVQVVANTVYEYQHGPNQDGGLGRNGGAVLGMDIEASGQIVVRGNRIYAGGVNGGFVDWVGDFHGIDVGQYPVDGGLSGPVIIVNNLIYGGPFAVTAQPAGNADGIYVHGSGTNGAEILYNTIFSGYAGGDGGTAQPVGMAQAQGVVVADNILAGVGPGSRGIDLSNFATVAALRNNLFVTVPTLAAAGTSSTDVTGTQQLFASLFDASVGGNLVMTASCSGADLEAGACIDQPACDGGSIDDCLATLIAGWTQSDQGYGLLFDAGWNLAPGVPCPIAQGALDLSDASPYPVAYDRNGSPRGPLPSIGASQLDGGCE